MAFVNQDITQNGLELLAKGVAGANIKFTKIVIGDGYLPDGVSPRDITAVINPVLELDITNLQHIGVTAIVGGVFNNSQMEQGFFYRELALKAEDPDKGDITYCYGNAGDLAEWIPPTGTPTVIEKTVDVLTIVGAAENVSAVINPYVYSRFYTTATMTTTWSGTGPYTQTIPVAGVLATDTPVFGPLWGNDPETREAQSAAWRMISRIETANGSLIITCDKGAPTTAVPFQLTAVRGGS